MSSRSFCQLLQVLLADRLGGLPTSPGFVDGIPLQVCGRWHPVRGPGLCTSGDLFHTVAGVTFYRTWTTLHPRVAVHRDHRSFVKRGGELGDCFVSWFGVDGECAWILVSALGLEEGGGGSFLTEVGKRGVAQLVECPPTTVVCLNRVEARL